MSVKKSKQKVIKRLMAKATLTKKRFKEVEEIKKVVLAARKSKKIQEMNKVILVVGRLKVAIRIKKPAPAVKDPKGEKETKKPISTADLLSY